MPCPIMKRIIRLILSPLLIGSLAGIYIPLHRYEVLLSNAELSHPNKQHALERLPQNIVIGCMIGLTIGVLADWAIRQFLARRSPRK